MTTINFTELAQLIVKAVATFDSVVAAAGCGCNIPRDYDLTETRRTYAKLATEFGLNPNRMSEFGGTIAGQCSEAPIGCLVMEWGKNHSAGIDNVWVQGGAIVTNLPADHPLYVAIRELTTQEVCNSSEMERRENAQK